MCTATCQGALDLLPHPSSDLRCRCNRGQTTLLTLLKEQVEQASVATQEEVDKLREDMLQRRQNVLVRQCGKCSLQLEVGQTTCPMCNNQVSFVDMQNCGHCGQTKDFLSTQTCHLCKGSNFTKVSLPTVEAIEHLQEDRSGLAAGSSNWLLNLLKLDPHCIICLQDLDLLRHYPVQSPCSDWRHVVCQCCATHQAYQQKCPYRCPVTTHSNDDETITKLLSLQAVLSEKGVDVLVA